MNKKIAMILAPLMVAMLVGTSYALWDKTLFIHGTVNTGEVDAEFTSVTCTEDGEVEGKDVGSCTAVIDQYNPQILLITIENGYPCYGCTIDFVITNTGTIPVKVNGISVTNLDPDVTVDVTLPAIGTQIHDDASVSGKIYVHVEQPASELTSYTFAVQIWLVQWNEFPYP